MKRYKLNSLIVHFKVIFCINYEDVNIRVSIKYLMSEPSDTSSVSGDTIVIFHYAAMTN